MKKSIKNKKKKRGFTLIELVIVLAVMGIIALIAIPTLAGTKENFRVKADKKSCQTIKRAVQIAIVDDDTPVADGTYYAQLDSNKKILNVTKALASNSTEEATLTKALKDINGPQVKDSTNYKIIIAAIASSADNKSITVSVTNSKGEDIDGIIIN